MEIEILKRAAAYFAREKGPSKMTLRLVQELADDGNDVAVTCRTLGSLDQASTSGSVVGRRPGTSRTPTWPTRWSMSTTCPGGTHGLRGFIPSCGWL